VPHKYFGAKILQIFNIRKENVCFYAFWGVFGDFRSQKNKKRHPGGWRNMQKFTKLPETNY
jgi:hypothetical protein